MYVGGQNITAIFLKLWIFSNLNKVFPVAVLGFDFNEFSEGVLHGHFRLHFDVSLSSDFAKAK
jgi:hypothetical protein